MSSTKYPKRLNNFNVPDQDHSNFMSFFTILKDIEIIYEKGFVFNGRFKKVVHSAGSYGTREHLAYYVTHECGCSSYRTIHSIKRAKTKVCGNCTYELTRRKITDNIRNKHVKQKGFYEGMLIEGAKILEVLRKKDKSDKWFYTLKVKCACEGITEVRPADLRRHYKPKQKNMKKTACKSCGTFLGLNYGKFAPVKTMIKRLEKEIEDVESGTRSSK
jgi:hypothetical protein